MSDNRKQVVKKIQFHAARRSSLELELVLNKFLDEYLDSFSYEELLAIEKLLEIDDLELSKAIFKREASPINMDPNLWKKVLDSIYAGQGQSSGK